MRKSNINKIREMTEEEVKKILGKGVIIFGKQRPSSNNHPNLHTKGGEK